MKVVAFQTERHSPSLTLNLNDDIRLQFGTSQDADLVWDTTDANANLFKIDLPAAGAVNLPIVAIWVGIAGVDLGVLNGSSNNAKYAAFGFSADAGGPTLEFFKSRGADASTPTVITTGDDLGFIRAWGYDGDSYVSAVSLTFDSEGTIADTRVPGKFAVSTNTDAAPSVLTAAFQINSAQQVRALATTDSTSATTGALISDGGIAAAKAIFAGGTSITLTAANSTNNSLVKVENTSNAAAASHAYFEAAVGGTTSTGDPHIRLTIPSGTSWYVGVDNSENDVLFIGTGTTVGSTGILRLSMISSESDATVTTPVLFSPANKTYTGAGG